jgi:hypothetical protein
MSSWKIIESSNYSVSAFGIVRNDITGKKLKPSKDRCGYLRVILTISGKKIHYTISRLVAMYFIPNDLHYRNQVNHIDGDKTNNKVNNLEWVTNRENMIHAVKTGLWKPYKRNKL